MPITYQLSSTLGDTGVLNELLVGGDGTPGSRTVSPSASSSISQGYMTVANAPGHSGATPTGTWSVEVNVTGGNTSVELSVILQRRSSDGFSVLTSVGPSAEQTASAGLKLFSFSNPALGTWGATDRLGVIVVARNTAAHGGTQSVTWDEDTADAEVLTQFSEPSMVGSAYVGGGYYG